MRIRYTDRANSFLNQLRERNEGDFHALNGIIVQLSVMPEVDNETIVYMDFGSGRSVPVYVDENWWIVYRVDNYEFEDTLVVISIWEADNPPHTRI